MRVERSNFYGLLKGLATCWGRGHQGLTVRNRDELLRGREGRDRSIDSELLMQCGHLNLGPRPPTADR